MAEGNNKYTILLEAMIQKIKQKQVDDAAKDLKPITIDINLATKEAKEQIEKIKQGLAGEGKLISTKGFFDEEGIKKYEVVVEKISSGVKTQKTVIATINKEQQISYEWVNKIEAATSKLSDKEKRQLDIYKAQVAEQKEKDRAQQAAQSKLDAEMKAHKSIGQMLKNNVAKVIEWAVSTGIVYGALHEIRKAMEYIVELNKEMTSIRMVTGMSADEAGQLANQYNELAKNMGVTTVEVAKGSLEWFRQGKTVEETGKLLESTLMMSKLGNMESAQATEYMTSTLNGFNLSAEESVGIIDRLVALDNSYATSVAEIASALQRSSNSAQQAGVTFDELASYITVVSSVTRKSAESIGESFPR